ncbi:MAG TPA: hypothetical protein VFP44_19520 [Usitatibacter sp.]|nr:hypothetical protein [Usitatibacter sp.]
MKIRGAFLFGVPVIVETHDVNVLMDVPDMGALMSAMESEAAATQWRLTP